MGATQSGRTRSYKQLDTAAKVYGNEHGVVGKPGGWIYRHGVPICQGWRDYGAQLVRNGYLEPRDAEGNSVRSGWSVYTLNGATQYALVRRCDTIGCHRPATETITYDTRNDGDFATDLACSTCADGYERRVVLTHFTRRPLEG